MSLKIWHEGFGMRDFCWGLGGGNEKGFISPLEFM